MGNGQRRLVSSTAICADDEFCEVFSPGFGGLVYLTSKRTTREISVGSTHWKLGMTSLLFITASNTTPPELLGDHSRDSLGAARDSQLSLSIESTPLHSQEMSKARL